MVERAHETLAEVRAKVMVVLAEKASTGDKNSLQEFADFAHKTPQGGATEVKASGLSQATVWGAEPEWVGESSEEEAETSTARREPENQLN